MSNKVLDIIIRICMVIDNVTSMLSAYLTFYLAFNILHSKPYMTIEAFRCPIGQVNNKQATTTTVRIVLVKAKAHQVN